LCEEYEVGISRDLIDLWRGRICVDDDDENVLSRKMVDNTEGVRRRIRDDGKDI
jgi:hypothetical protein